MPKTTIDQCADPTRDMTLSIPCKLAERVDAYAKETGSDIENLVIEALDVFLRDRARKH